MEDIKNVSIELLNSPNFVKPIKMNFSQNGRNSYWEMVDVHDSVAIIIFNKDKKKLIFVKQFRPAVYYSSIPQEARANIDVEKYPANIGVTLEFCAGIVDKSLSLAQIAKDEVLEECGYDAPLHLFEKVTTCRGGVGASGSVMTMFYIEVTEKMKQSSGGGLAEEGELIDLVEMSIQESQAYTTKDKINSPGSFLFGLLWFYQNKAPAYL